MDHGTIIGYDEDDEPICLDCGTDGYDAIPHCLQKLSVVRGDLQPGNSKETMQQYGSSTQSTFTLFLPLGTDIKADDKIEADGYTGYFQVKGDPLQFRSLIPHMEINLTKERI